MTTKENDILYCGVNEEKIKNANPVFNEEVLSNLKTWLFERYLIHKKKDVEKLPKPWTSFEPLKKFKFTNVKRYHDKQTLHLIENIINNMELTYEEKLLNIMLFRTWNVWETMRDLGGPFKKDQLVNYEQFRSLSEELQKKFPKRVWFTNAFNSGGLKQTWQYKDGKGYRAGYRKTEDAKDKSDHEKNILFRMFYLSNWLIENNIIGRMSESRSQKEVFDVLLSIPGFGGFLAYQVYVDLSYIPEFPFSENEFTVSGPGCKRGLNFLFEDRAGLTDEELLFWMRDNQDLFEIDFDSLMNDLPPHDRGLTVMDLENAMCELGKLTKLLKEIGRPKIKYNGTSEHKLF